MKESIKQQISLWINKDLYKELKIISVTRGITITLLIEEGLAKYIKKNSTKREKNIEALKDIINEI